MLLYDYDLNILRSAFLSLVYLPNNYRYVQRPRAADFADFRRSDGPLIEPTVRQTDRSTAGVSKAASEAWVKTFGAHFVSCHISSAVTKPRSQEGRQVALSWRKRLSVHLVH